MVHMCACIGCCTCVCIGCIHWPPPPQQHFPPLACCSWPLSGPAQGFSPHFQFAELIAAGREATPHRSEEIVDVVARRWTNRFYLQDVR